MWNITNGWRWSVWACENKTRQWDQLWTTKCGEDDKEEGESWTSGVSQPGKRSVWEWFITTEWKMSFPATQTPSSSPALKGGCCKPFQQLAQEHDFTENLIHTLLCALNFLTSEHPTCIVWWLHLVKIISLLCVQVRLCISTCTFMWYICTNRMS